MKALVLESVGASPALREVDDPARGPEPTAVVQIEAAALNHRDLWIQRGLYPKLTLPAILGSDGAGVVEAVHDGDATWIGRKVVINPSLDWGDDERAQGPRWTILGMPTQGTFAESIAVPIGNLAPLPEHLDAVHAAALPLAGLTAWRALMTRAALRPGERVLITGIGGGVAAIALQLALAAGAEVWVTSSSEAKLERAVELGARGGFLYRDKNWVTEAKKTLGGGADVILDGAGGPGFAGLVDVLALGGRIAVYGATTGAWPELVAAKLFFKQVSIVTTTMGSPREFAALVDFVAAHRIQPLVDRIFSFEQGHEAFDHLAGGGHFGKVVMTMT
jgi:NADPH:quinone reductase-like Zn-dependent oxidoreductase